MTAKKLQERIDRLMPGGIPRYVRCYDNGGRSYDRYTCFYTGQAATERNTEGQNWYPYSAMSARPFHPQGFGQHGSNPGQPCDTCAKPRGYSWPPAIGRSCHLGKRIKFEDLPPDCQRLVLQDYRLIWKLDPQEK